jgi:polysaccharide export outer membrane protein
MTQRACSWEWFLAGIRNLASVLLIPVLCGTLCSGLAAADDGMAELSFSLPAGDRDVVGVAFHAGGLSVRLPAGSDVPEDILAVGRGLVRSGRLHREPDGSVRYEIGLAASIPEQVLLLPNHLVIRIREVQQGVSLAGRDQTYLLGSGDRIRISVDGQPNLLTEAEVSRNGKVSAPLIGEVEAVGRTAEAVAEEVAKLLGEDYLVNPNVDVQVTEYNSQWVLATGQVMRPGRIALRGGTTLKEIIGEAGGFTPLAGSRIQVVYNPEVEGRGRTAEVVSRAEFEAGLTHTVPLHGSVVHVEKIAYAFIQGEIERPGKVELEPGMTLLKAIAVMGGLTEWANRKEIRILDGDSDRRAKVYNLKKIQAEKEPDPVLEEGQMIIIPRRFL